MTTRFDELAIAFNGRWKPEWSGSPTFGQVQNALNGSLNAVRALIGTASALKAEDKYSPQGLNDEIRTIAKRDTIPVLLRAAQTIDHARTEVRNTRDGLTLPKIDARDAAGAMLRAEMRAWLKSLPRGETMSHLLNDKIDQRLLLAAIEAPPQMIGLDEQTRAQVLDHVLKRDHGVEIARLDRLSDAAELANSAIGACLYQLQREAGFGDSGTNGFDAWMASASAEIDKQIASENAGPDDGSGMSQTGPSEFEREVAVIMDEVFAKALPHLYPDHPVNRQQSQP